MARGMKTAAIDDSSQALRRTYEADAAGASTAGVKLGTDDSAVALRRLAFEIGRIAARSLTHSEDNDTPTDALFTLALIWFAIVIVFRLATSGSIAY